MNKVVFEPPPPEVRADLKALLSVFERDVEAGRLNWAVLDFFDRNPNPCWIRQITAPGEFKLIRVNRAFEAGMGVTAEEVIGKDPASVWPLNVVKAGVARDQEVAETGQLVTYRNTIGEVVWTVQKWPIKDPAGCVIGICGTAVAL
jgi:PAS domain S-box-containing protein